MKALLSILLGLMLVTSTLVGIVYATPISQPSQNNGGDINSCVQLTPNNPYYYTLGCAGAAHQNGNDNPPQHACVDGRIGPDFACACLGITPHSLQVSDIHTDLTCEK